MFPESFPQTSPVQPERKRSNVDPEGMTDNQLLEFKKAIEWHLKNMSSDRDEYEKMDLVVERIMMARGLTTLH